MQISDEKKAFLEVIVKVIAYAVKSDREVVKEEMDLVQVLLNQTFEDRNVLGFVRRQLVTHMVRSTKMEELAEDIAYYFKSRAEHIIIIHFMLNLIGSDNRLLDVEFDAIKDLFVEIGMPVEELKAVDAIYFRSRGQLARGKEAIEELAKPFDNLYKGYQTLMETYYGEDGAKFGDEIYMFIKSQLAPESAPATQS